MKRLALLSLCLCLSAFAADNPFKANVTNTTMLNPECPITLTGIYAGPQGHGGARVSVHFVNASEKRLIAIKLGLTGFDATRDARDFSQPYSLAVNLKPHKEAQPIWRIPDESFDLDTASGARVYLMKVVYGNGATWEDDGARSCSLSIQGIAKPRHSDE